MSVRSWFPAIVACAVVAPSGRAHADPPPPGEEGGGSDANEPGESAWRGIERGLLYVPKVLVETLELPFHAGVYVYDRYQLEDVYYRTFYDRDRTIGVVPTAAYQTGYGFTAGASLIATDLFGEREHGSIDAMSGGEFSDVIQGYIDSGHRLGRLVLRVDGDFIRRPHDPFYGIGNASVGVQPMMPIDPLTSDAAYETFVRYRELRAMASADVRVVDALHVIGRVSATELSFDQSTDGVPLASVYDPADLVGFQQGVDHADGELEVRWDRRRPANILEATPRSEGFLAAAYAARVHRLDRGDDFTHYGFDLQDYIHLGLGPRMLVVRALFEGVTGPLDEVPFSELPALGGDFLRGYTFDRFRDRVAALGSVEYAWDLLHFCNMYVFTDVGRVYDSLDALTPDHLRVGYGVGLEFHGEDRGFLLETYIASSIDGGLVVSAVFNPIANQRPRWR